MEENNQLHHNKELDQLKSVWVKRQHENFLVVGGTINTFTATSLRKEAEDWIYRLNKSYKKVVIDLEPSNPQGTVCVSFMLCLYRYADKLKIALEFKNVPDQLLGIVNLSGLTDILKLTLDKSTKAEATKY